MELRDSIFSTEVHIIEILGWVMLHKFFHRNNKLLAVQTLLEQVLYSHKDLTMLGSFLHFLSSNVLVLSHHAVLGILEAFKLLLPLRDLVVKLDLLSDCPLCCLLYLGSELFELLIQPLLFPLQLPIRFLQGLVPGEDVVKLLKLIRVLLFHLFQEGFKFLHVLNLSLYLFRLLKKVRGFF